MKKFSILFLILILTSFCFLSCTKVEDDTPKADNDELTEEMDISALDISEYVTLCEYKEMEVSYDPDKISKGDAAWQALLSRSTILKYPQQQVDYYFDQKRAGYEYMARAGSQTYDELIASLGVTEDMMLEESKKLVAQDLVFFALIKAEGIELTQKDKDDNFERYVEKFVADYGYTEEYVREHLDGQIYETMLYDKALEKLSSFCVFFEVKQEE